MKAEKQPQIQPGPRILQGKLQKLFDLLHPFDQACPVQMQNLSSPGNIHLLVKIDLQDPDILFVLLPVKFKQFQNSLRTQRLYGHMPRTGIQGVGQGIIFKIINPLRVPHINMVIGNISFRIKSL